LDFYPICALKSSLPRLVLGRTVDRRNLAARHAQIDRELPAMVDHVVQHLPEKILPAHIAHLLGCRIELDRRIQLPVVHFPDGIRHSLEDALYFADGALPRIGHRGHVRRRELERELATCFTASILVVPFLFTCRSRSACALRSRPARWVAPRPCHRCGNCPPNCVSIRPPSHKRTATSRHRGSWRFDTAPARSCGSWHLDAGHGSARNKPRRSCESFWPKRGAPAFRWRSCNVPSRRSWE